MPTFFGSLKHESPIGADEDSKYRRQWHRLFPLPFSELDSGAAAVLVDELDAMKSVKLKFFASFAISLVGSPPAIRLAAG